MRLGIDLDNTLICYDEVFLWGAHKFDLVPKDWKGGKRQLRQYLKGQPDGEDAWRNIQRRVYGDWIQRAKLFPGVYRFLWRCQYRGIMVEVISHKSEYGHFDEERVSLRQSARDFLIQAGIFSEEGKSEGETRNRAATRSFDGEPSFKTAAPAELAPRSEAAVTGQRGSSQ